MSCIKHSVDHANVGLACWKEAAAFMSIPIEYSVGDKRLEAAMRHIAKERNFSIEMVSMSVSCGGKLGPATNLAMLEDFRTICVLEESNRSVPEACAMWSPCRSEEVVPDVHRRADYWAQSLAEVDTSLCAHVFVAGAGDLEGVEEEGDDTDNGGANAPLHSPSLIVMSMLSRRVDEQVLLKLLSVVEILTTESLRKPIIARVWPMTRVQLMRNSQLIQRLRDVLRTVDAFDLSTLLASPKASG